MLAFSKKSTKSIKEKNKNNEKKYEIQFQEFFKVKVTLYFTHY